MPDADIGHATMTKVDREEIAALARKKSKTVEELLLEWAANPSKAPREYLAAMSSEYHRKLGKTNTKAWTPEKLSARASAGGSTMHAKRVWGGDPEVMLKSFLSLRKLFGARKYTAACKKLGIQPEKFTEAEGGEYTAFINLRKELGFKVQRSAARRWKGSVSAMRADFLKLRDRAGAAAYDEACQKLRIQPSKFKKAEATETFKFYRLAKALGVQLEGSKKKA